MMAGSSQLSHDQDYLGESNNFKNKYQKRKCSKFSRSPGLHEVRARLARIVLLRFGVGITVSARSINDFSASSDTVGITHLLASSGVGFFSLFLVTQIWGH